MRFGVWMLGFWGVQMLPLHVEGVWEPRGLVKQFHGDFHPSHGMDFPYKIITSAGGEFSFFFRKPASISTLLENIHDFHPTLFFRVGGFNQPNCKKMSQNGFIFPKRAGENEKIFETTT